MFKRIIQPGLLSIFDADQDNPLKLWGKKIRDGQIKRTVSDDIKGLVLEMSSKTPLTTYISSPSITNQNLGIQFRYFHMIVKLPLKTFFAFDIQVIDDKSIKRRFRMSTVQTFVDICPFMCKLPLFMESGWNHVTMPLHTFLKDVYGTSYAHTVRVAVYPNCLLKKIYFSDQQYYDEDVPVEFQIEDSDPAENYRKKYTKMVTQERKNSLSYYNDLFNQKGKRTSCAIHYTL